jgi:enoyl-CoA hydratase
MTTDSSAQPVDLHVTPDADGIATLTVPGRKSMNIIGSPEITALTHALQRLREAPGLRVLVLRGRDDRAFIGGADIAEMATLTPVTAEHFITGLKGLCDAVRLFPAPVIGRLAGWCLGGGLEVAMACDLRLAAEGAQFGMPETKVGIPSVIHATLLPRLVGDAAARWLLLTGDTIDATEAHRLGLVHRLVAATALDAAVNHTAKQLAALGPAVLRQQKRMLRDWQDLPLDTAIARSVGEFGQAFSTGEPQRYMQQFLNRRR